MSDLKNVTVGVIKGGQSAERDISLMTGEGVEKGLADAGIPFKSIELSRNEIKSDRLDGVDLVFIALHGPYGEDGTLQAELDKLGMPYVGSGAEASQLAMDKLQSKEKFSLAGLAIPPYERLTDDLNENTLKTLGKSIGYPLVVKPNAEGSSIGISIVKEESSLCDAVKLALGFSGVAIMEQFISGRSIEIAIVDRTALPVIEVKPAREFYDYKAKYFDEKTQYIIDPEMDSAFKKDLQRVALSAHDCLGCRHYSRVDMILGDDDKAYILEVNTLPGMTATSLLPKAAAKTGMNFQTLTAKLIQLALNQKSGQFQ